MKKARIRYNETFANVTEDSLQQASTEEALGTLTGMIKDFKELSGDGFDECYDSSLYTLK